jgi:hypothetical protein
VAGAKSNPASHSQSDAPHSGTKHLACRFNFSGKLFGDVFPSFNLSSIASLFGVDRKRRMASRRFEWNSPGFSEPVISPLSAIHFLPEGWPIITPSAEDKPVEFHLQRRGTYLFP